MCPRRLLRTGRGPITSRSVALLHHPSRVRTQKIAEAPSAIPTAGEDYDLIIKYNSYPRIPIPKHLKSDPDSYMPYLSQYVRPQRKHGTPRDPSAPLMQHKEDLDRVYNVMGCLWDARKCTKPPLLVHMGFHRKQWSTVHAILSDFVDVYELLAPYMDALHPRVRPAIGLNWASCDENFNQLSNPRLIPPVFKHKIEPLRSDYASLDALTSRPVGRGFGDRILAELLQNLGSLVLAAADHPPEESKLAMSCVYRILARLHNLGLISDKVYQFSPNDPSLLSCRPPGLHLLSSHIMTVLSDAAWKEHESALAAAATEAGEDPPFLPFQVGIRELGPEIWLELILWCCVEHGFPRHGAKLVEEMTQRTGDQAWKAEGWQPLIQAMDVVHQTDISAEQFWRRPGSDEPPKFLKDRNKPPFHGLGKRTISSEVVACLRSGLTNHAYNGVGYSGTKPMQLLKLAAPLTSMLDPPGPKSEVGPTNRWSNWQLREMLQSGCLRPEQDPDTFGRVLESTRDVVPPWCGDGIRDDDKLRALTRAQIYDQSAAMLGLAEYNTKAFARQRRVGQAFYEFARLQNIVDACKVYRIREFFESVRQPKATDLPFFSDSQPVIPQMRGSSLPEISPVTLAELLDVATGSRTYESGSWLLFNQDVDGPSITKSMYGKQLMAPAILRFAAATQNEKLCKEVLARLEMPLSVNTLKALLNFRIAIGDWDRVTMTLEYFRDYRAKAWGFSNVLALGAKLIRLHASVEGMQQRGSVNQAEVKSLERAGQIFQQFFREEFNTPTGKNRLLSDFQHRVLVRCQQVFKTLPGPLPDLLEKVKFNETPAHRTKTPYIPATCFNQLLSAIVDVHGSVAAWRVFTQWCLSTPYPRRSRQMEGGVSRLSVHHEREKYRGDFDFDAVRFAQIQSKSVEPNLNTIRIIAQAAFQDFKRTQEKSRRSPSASDDGIPSSHRPSSPKLFFVHNESAYSEHYKLNMPGQLSRYFSVEGGEWPSCDAEAILDRCLCIFLAGGLRFEHIEYELPGFVDRLRERGILTRHVRDSRALERFGDIGTGPWLKLTGGNRPLSSSA